MKKYCFTQYFFSLKVSGSRRLIFPNEGYVKVHFHNFRVTEIYETSEASALIDTNKNMKERCFTRRSFNLNKYFYSWTFSTPHKKHKHLHFDLLLALLLECCFYYLAPLVFYVRTLELHSYCVDSTKFSLLFPKHINKVSLDL